MYEFNQNILILDLSILNIMSVELYIFISLHKQENSA